MHSLSAAGCHVVDGLNRLFFLEPRGSGSARMLPSTSSLMVGSTVAQRQNYSLNLGARKRRNRPGYTVMCCVLYSITFSVLPAMSPMDTWLASKLVTLHLKTHMKDLGGSESVWEATGA
jgi:hypothetical protein